MRAVVTLQLGLIRQPQERLVNKLGRLEGAIANFTLQARPGKAKQVIVDDRSEPF
jgi:hypothetical protein